MTDAGASVPRHLVFDASPLNHMARAQLLGVLKALSAGRVAVLTDIVEMELRNGVHLAPGLAAVLEATWLNRRVLGTASEIEWYQVFAQRLVGATGRNRGECSVLAWAKANDDAEVVIDDAEGRQIAREYDIPCRGTLRFLLDAVNEAQLSRNIASSLADEVLASGSRLPFGAGGFLAWADQSGLI